MSNKITKVNFDFKNRKTGALFTIIGAVNSGKTQMLIERFVYHSIDGEMNAKFITPYKTEHMLERMHMIVDEYDGVDNVADLDCNVISTDGYTSIDDLIEYIDQTSEDYIIIDDILMIASDMSESDSAWESQTIIAKKLASSAKRNNKVIIVSLQSNRSGSLSAGCDITPSGCLLYADVATTRDEPWNMINCRRRTMCGYDTGWNNSNRMAIGYHI